MTVSRDSHSSVWVCCHPCISGVPWPGCRKEAHSLRSVGMQGVLWLLPDELPEDLRPSPKLVSPSVPEDEEPLPQGRLAWDEIYSTGHCTWTFPVTSSGVSALGRAKLFLKGKVVCFLITVMWKSGHARS